MEQEYTNEEDQFYDEPEDKSKDVDDSFGLKMDMSLAPSFD